jgi:hypothetical protein
MEERGACKVTAVLHLFRFPACGYNKNISMLRKFLALSLCFAASLSADDAKRLTIIYTSNRQGEVEPCGCLVNKFGGLGRMGAFVETEKKRGPVLFVDSGDSFFSSPQLNPLTKRKEELRAEVIAKSYGYLGLDAFSPGERDLALGAAALKKFLEPTKIPIVSANLVDEDREFLFQRWTIVTKGKIRIGLTGVTSQEALLGLKEVQALPETQALKEALTELRKQAPDVIVLLSHMGLKKDREIAESESDLIIVGAHSLDALESPEKIKTSLIFQPMHEGQHLGSFVWEKGKGARDHKLVAMNERYDGKNPVRALLEEHRRKLSSLGLNEENEVSQAHKKISKRPFIAHPETCKGCHEPQYKFWESTKHASAMLVLYSKGQHLDSECIGCHSLGFRSSAGFDLARNAMVLGDPQADRAFVDTFLRGVFEKDPGSGDLDSRKEPERYSALKKTYHEHLSRLESEGKISKVFAGVQCEHCHGNRHGHPAEKREKKKVSVQSCKSCHTPERSTGFQASWKEKVACPPRRDL